MSIRPKQVHFEPPLPSFHFPSPSKTEEDLAIEKATQYFLTATKNKRMIKYIKDEIGDRTFTCLRSNKGNPKPLVKWVYRGNAEKQNLHIKRITAVLSKYIPKK